jgi:hypothetical protein
LEFVFAFAPAVRDAASENRRRVEVASTVEDVLPARVAVREEQAEAFTT